MGLRWQSRSFSTICKNESKTLNVWEINLGLYKSTFYDCVKIWRCRGQAEREFRVEVEAIGHVRHKNLVRLLGYCIEGVHR